MSNREEVAKGARLMDRILPGWYRGVDLDRLNMSDGTMCLLGQTFGVHAERSLAREMYPKEFTAALLNVKADFATDSPRYKSFGFNIASSNRPLHGGMIDMILKKLGLDRDTEVYNEQQALRRVCSGHLNTKCEWAAEVAERLAKDEEVKNGR